MEAVLSSRLWYYLLCFIQVDSNLSLRQTFKSVTFQMKVSDK